MPIVSRVFVNRDQLDAEIKKAIPKLGPEAVHVAYRLGPDHDEVPSIFFRITLDDEAAREEILNKVTRRMVETMIDELQPIENWGLHPYFNFRSQTERQRRYNPDWE